MQSNVIYMRSFQVLRGHSKYKVAECFICLNEEDILLLLAYLLLAFVQHRSAQKVVQFRKWLQSKRPNFELKIYYIKKKKSATKQQQKPESVSYNTTCHLSSILYQNKGPQRDLIQPREMHVYNTYTICHVTCLCRGSQEPLPWSFELTDSWVKNPQISLPALSSKPFSANGS